MNENGKKIWITGASSGIGKALAIKFANNGWQVAASARRENLLQDLNKINLLKLYLHLILKIVYPFYF